VTSSSAYQGLFDDALLHASPGFALGKRLAELHPELALIEGESHLFDVETFARDGKCAVETTADLYHQYDTLWFPDHGIHRSAKC